jgi:hypothetical protein
MGQLCDDAVGVRPARHGHRGLLVLGDHVLAQPRPTGLAGFGADPQPLLGAGHRLVGGGAGGVAADRAAHAVVVGALAVARDGPDPGRGVRARPVPVPVPVVVDPKAP